MRKIKVLHIIKTLNLGGAETNLFNLVNAIDKDKVEAHVAYSFGGEIERRFLQGSVRLFKYAEGDHKIKSLASIGIIYRLARYIVQNGIDIVHTHIFNAHVWGTAAAKLTGRKVVEHVHDFRYLDPGEFRKRYGTNRQYGYAPYLKRLSDIVLVLTRQNYEFLIARNTRFARRIREIKNGIPMTERASFSEKERLALKEKLQIDPDAFVIFSSARIAPEKNIDLIFRIAPTVLRRIPNTVFLVSGNGPLLDYYRARCQAMGLEKNVRLIGFQQDVYPLLAISDIFLLPSFLELHSIAVLEAMSMQVPVILSKDVGCNNEFVRDWENGVLVDPFSDLGWDESIFKLQQAPELRRKIGRQGYETCSELFNIRAISSKIEGIYAELVAN